MKIYKHRKFGYIATEKKGCYILSNHDVAHWDGQEEPVFSKEFIENSNNRDLQQQEEVKSNWVDIAILEFKMNPLKKVLSDIGLKKSIEKHMPKITKEDLDRHKIREDGDRLDIINLLKEKGLYK